MVNVSSVLTHPLLNFAINRISSRKYVHMFLPWTCHTLSMMTLSECWTLSIGASFTAVPMSSTKYKSTVGYYTLNVAVKPTCIYCGHSVKQPPHYYSHLLRSLVI